MARVTGIGGVFLKCKGDSAALAAWYRDHLGMPLEGFGGAVLRWPDDTADDWGLTVWHVADRDSRWFSPSEASFMINYRVDDLDALLAQLRPAAWRWSRGRSRTRTASSRGSWIRTATRWSSGNRCPGIPRTSRHDGRAPAAPAFGRLRGRGGRPRLTASYSSKRLLASRSRA